MLTTYAAMSQAMPELISGYRDEELSVITSCMIRAAAISAGQIRRVAMRGGGGATAASIEFLVTSLIVAATPGTGVLYTPAAGLRTRFDLRTDFGIGRLSIVLIEKSHGSRNRLIGVRVKTLLDLLPNERLCLGTRSNSSNSSPRATPIGEEASLRRKLRPCPLCCKRLDWPDIRGGALSGPGGQG